MATRLYLRDTPSYEAPTAGTKSTALPNAASNDGNSGNPFENRSLLTVRGQTLPDSTVSRSSIGSTAHVDQYMGRFTSRKLAAQTIAANTWTCAVATLETNTAANSFTMLSVYVWRPSNSSVVGYIYDSHTALGVEWSTGLDGQVLTFSGSSVTAQAGDVIVMEFWRHTDGQGSSTARLQQLNYNGHVDVTGTTTADPASYLETPQNLTFDTAYLPAAISGVFIETPGFGGPVIDGNGNLYVLAEVTELEPDPAIYKSTDGGLTWAEMDSANRPNGYEDLESASLLLSGDKIKYARMRSGTSAVHLSYHEFNVSTHSTDPDEWALNETIVNVASGDPTQEQLTLLERSNGDLVLVYGEWVSSSSSRIVYRKKPSGGAWGSAVGVYTGAIGSCAVLGASDKIHIFCKEDTSSAVGGSANQIVHLSLSSSDVLSSAEVVNDNAVTSLENMPGRAVYYDDAGAETIFVAWGKSDGFLAGAFVINDGTPGAEETITDQIVWFNPPDTGPLCPIAALAVDAATKTIYCAYSNNPSNTPTAQAPASEGDLYLATRTHGVGWGTDVELRDGVRIQDIFANVYTHSSANGGATVLGMFYDDANGPFYDEYVISEGSNEINDSISAGASAGASVSSVADIDKTLSAGASAGASVSSVADIDTALSATAEVDAAAAAGISRDGSASAAAEVDAAAAATAIRVGSLAAAAETETAAAATAEMDSALSAGAQTQTAAAATAEMGTALSGAAAVATTAAAGLARDGDLSAGAQTQTAATATTTRASSLSAAAEVDVTAAETATRVGTVSAGAETQTAAAATAEMGSALSGTAEAETAAAATAEMDSALSGSAATALLIEGEIDTGPSEYNESISISSAAGSSLSRTVSAPRSMSLAAQVAKTDTALSTLPVSMSLGAELDQSLSAVLPLVASLTLAMEAGLSDSSTHSLVAGIVLPITPGAGVSVIAQLGRSISLSIVLSAGSGTSGDEDLEMFAQLVARASASLGTAVSSSPTVGLETANSGLALSLLSGTSAGHTGGSDVSLSTQLVAVAAAALGTTASLAESAAHELHVGTVIATVVGASPPSSTMSMSSLLVLDVQAEALASGGFTLTGTIDLPVSVGQAGDSNPATAVSLEFALEVGAETARQLSAAAALELAVSSALSCVASTTSRAALQIAVSALMGSSRSLDVDRAIELAVETLLSEGQQMDQGAAILLTVHSALSAISLLVGDQNITTHVALAGVRHGAVGLTGTARLRVALRGLARLRVDLPDSDQ